MMAGREALTLKQISVEYSLSPVGFELLKNLALPQVYEHFYDALTSDVPDLESDSEEEVEEDISSLNAKFRASVAPLSTLPVWVRFTEIEEDYEVLQQLGEGTNGAVYRCRPRDNSNKEYAAKMFSCEDVEIEVLTAEIEALADCQSEHVVQFRGVHILSNKVWLLMELCAGSILDIINETGMTLTELEIRAVCAQALIGLHVIHGKKFIHRDIKAANLLITRRGEVRIADFGILGRLRPRLPSGGPPPMTRRQSVIGTSYWMAPEILDELEEGYDEVADVWSVGITAIEMADGEPPRFNLHPSRAMFLISSSPAPTLDSEGGWTPAFHDFVAKCLTKDPRERSTVEDLLKHPFLIKEVGLMLGQRGPGASSLQHPCKVLRDLLKMAKKEVEPVKEEPVSHLVDDAMHYHRTSSISYLRPNRQNTMDTYDTDDSEIVDTHMVERLMSIKMEKVDSDEESDGLLAAMDGKAPSTVDGSMEEEEGTQAKDSVTTDESQHDLANEAEAETSDALTERAAQEATAEERHPADQDAEVDGAGAGSTMHVRRAAEDAEETQGSEDPAVVATQFVDDVLCTIAEMAEKTKLGPDHVPLDASNWNRAMNDEDVGEAGPAPEEPEPISMGVAAPQDREHDVEDADDEAGGTAFDDEETHADNGAYEGAHSDDEDDDMDVPLEAGLDAATFEELPGILDRSSFMSSATSALRGGASGNQLDAGNAQDRVLLSAALETGAVAPLEQRDAPRPKRASATEICAAASSSPDSSREGGSKRVVSFRLGTRSSVGGQEAEASAPSDREANAAIEKGTTAVSASDLVKKVASRDTDASSEISAGQTPVPAYSAANLRGKGSPSPSRVGRAAGRRFSVSAFLRTDAKSRRRRAQSIHEEAPISRPTSWEFSDSSEGKTTPGHQRATSFFSRVSGRKTLRKSESRSSTSTRTGDWTPKVDLDPLDSTTPRHGEERTGFKTHRGQLSLGRIFGRVQPMEVPVDMEKAPQLAAVKRQGTMSRKVVKQAPKLPLALLASAIVEDALRGAELTVATIAESPKLAPSLISERLANLLEEPVVLHASFRSDLNSSTRSLISVSSRALGAGSATSLVDASSRSVTASPPGSPGLAAVPICAPSALLEEGDDVPMLSMERHSYRRSMHNIEALELQVAVRRGRHHRSTDGRGGAEEKKSPEAAPSRPMVSSTASRELGRESSAFSSFSSCDTAPVAVHSPFARQDAHFVHANPMAKLTKKIFKQRSSSLAECLAHRPPRFIEDRTTDSSAESEIASATPAEPDLEADATISYGDFDEHKRDDSVSERSSSSFSLSLSLFRRSKSKKAEAKGSHRRRSSTGSHGLARRLFQKEERSKRRSAKRGFRKAFSLWGSWRKEAEAGLDSVAEDVGEV